MIIVDFNQVVISNMMVESQGNMATGDLQEGLIRHMILNSIRSYVSKWGDKYGELVIACDDGNYWRKKLFPYYKANRKKDRDASGIDWNKVFEILNKVRDEIKEFLPFRVIHVETAEADDIIATLCHNFGTRLHTDRERILILSGDKDFGQLQVYTNVDQHNPIQKANIVVADPEKFLMEHIIRGDVGDGVPNFLSADNCLVAGIRQKPIMQKKLDVWLNQEPKDFCDEYTLKNYERNRALIDLQLIPTEIGAEAMKQYEQQKNKDASKVLDYFIARGLKHLMGDIQDFRGKK